MANGLTVIKERFSDKPIQRSNILAGIPLAEKEDVNRAVMQLNKLTNSENIERACWFSDKTGGQTFREQG